MHKLVEEHKEDLLKKLEFAKEVLEAGEDIEYLCIQMVIKTDGQLKKLDASVGDAEFGIQFCVDTLTDRNIAYKKRFE